MLFALTNPLFSLVVVYLFSYAKGYDKKRSVIFLGAIMTVLYIVGNFVASFFYLEFFEPTIEIMALCFSFIPVANWANALIFSL